MALSSLSFDMCVYEVLGALCAGAGIVMPEQSQLREPLEWARLIQAHQVTIWNSAPALLKMLMDLVEAEPPGQGAHPNNGDHERMRPRRRHPSCRSRAAVSCLREHSRRHSQARATSVALL